MYNEKVIISIRINHKLHISLYFLQNNLVDSRFLRCGGISFLNLNLWNIREESPPEVLKYGTI